MQYRAETIKTADQSYVRLYGCRPKSVLLAWAVAGLNTGHFLDPNPTRSIQGGPKNKPLSHVIIKSY